eukprot:362540-Chlamydomonas_euryale.AAC.5
MSRTSHCSSRSVSAAASETRSSIVKRSVVRHPTSPSSRAAASPPLAANTPRSAEKAPSLLYSNWHMDSHTHVSTRSIPFTIRYRHACAASMLATSDGCPSFLFIACKWYSDTTSAAARSTAVMYHAAVRRTANASTGACASSIRRSSAAAARARGAAPAPSSAGSTVRRRQTGDSSLSLKTVSA